MDTRKLVVHLVALGTVAFWAGCGSDGGKKVLPPEDETPLISSLSPDSAAVGDTIEVLGSRFGSPAQTSRVHFGQLVAGTPLWTDTRIRTIVPTGAQSGNVQVVAGGLTSNAMPFRVGSTPPPPIITIERLVPVRTVAADTVRVIGSGFGPAQGASQVTFAGAADARIGAEILSWSETEIRAIVPDGAADGPILVVTNAASSNGVTFSRAARLISYTADLIPLFQVKGCADCHGGTNNLFLDSAKSALSGESVHGPVILPRDGAHSILYQKATANPPFGSRMPLGCSQVCLSSADLRLITDWIDQGARDN